MVLSHCTGPGAGSMGSNILCRTILHSSRMHTARALTISRGGVPVWSRGVYLPGPGGWYVPGPRGCTCLVWGVYVPGPGGVPAWSPGGGAVPGQVLPPWTEFLTHASENITLPQTSFAGGNNSDWSDTVTGIRTYCFLLCQFRSLYRPRRSPVQCE